MGIRSLCAAAVVAVGFGSAADAATVTHNIIFTMNFLDGPQYHWGIKEGQKANGTLEIIEGSFDENWLTLTINGYSAYSGKASGSGGYYDGITGIVGYGYQVIQWGLTSGKFADAYDDEDGIFELQAEGTMVLGTLPPSPIPLPAAAAFLPIGIGALAVMRKRRRSA